MSIERRQRRPVVLPKPSTEQIRNETEKAIDQYQADANMSNVIDQTSPVRPPTRPDLGRAVTGGIQQQRIRSLPGR